MVTMTCSDGQVRSLFSHCISLTLMGRAKAEAVSKTGQFKVQPALVSYM